MLSETNRFANALPLGLYDGLQTAAQCRARVAVSDGLSRKTFRYAHQRGEKTWEEVQPVFAACHVGRAGLMRDLLLKNA